MSGSVNSRRGAIINMNGREKLGARLTRLVSTSRLGADNVVETPLGLRQFCESPAYVLSQCRRFRVEYRIA